MYFREFWALHLSSKPHLVTMLYEDHKQNQSVVVVGENKNDMVTTGTVIFRRHIIVVQKELPVKPRPTERQITARNSDIRRFAKIPDEHIYVNLNKKM